MGLCASQARLLMLTARKDDLEFRMQQITNDKMTLAREEEGIATKYNNALSNRCFTKINTGKELNASSIASMLGGTIAFSSQSAKASFKEKYEVDDWDSLTPTQVYDAFLNGLIQLESEEKDENGKPIIIDISSDTQISDEYYTGDDGIAEIEYEAAMAKIKTKEQKLDLEAKQLETQYTAVTTEIESVQNIVKKESEGTFKYFS